MGGRGGGRRRRGGGTEDREPGTRAGKDRGGDVGPVPILTVEIACAECEVTTWPAGKTTRPARPVCAATGPHSDTRCLPAVGGLHLHLHLDLDLGLQVRLGTVWRHADCMHGACAATLHTATHPSPPDLPTFLSAYLPTYITTYLPTSTEDSGDSSVVRAPDS